MTTLKLENVEKVFEDYIVFKDITYQFESGKIYALVGKSGSGKTTLLNSIGKLTTLNSGKISIDGNDIAEIRTLNYYRNYIGYLFQNYALVDEDTVEQNLNIVKRHKKEDLVDSLKKFDLNDKYLKRKVFTLSGGEAQRVALARLDLQNPLIILADEPTGALDHQNRQLVLKSLRDIANENKIVIIATHDDVVRDFADDCLDVSKY